MGWSSMDELLPSIIRAVPNTAKKKKKKKRERERERKLRKEKE
jgi:hypothetical protein